MHPMAMPSGPPNDGSGSERAPRSEMGARLEECPGSAKMASSNANQDVSGPSIDLESRERLETVSWASGPDSGDSAKGKSSSTANTMGMSVALDGDARQAAAVKLAEEQALVRRAQSGDRLAFEDLVRRYDRDVLRLARNLVHKPEDARDIYQESFLRVYRNLHRFRFECSFYTWLYRIVTNVALDHLRRRSSRPEDQAPVPEDAEGGTRDFFDRQPQQRAAANPEKSLLGRELGKHIQEAMKRLSPRERMVFEMKHFQGLRLRAIGDILGTSEETAKNSLFRATRKLRESLEPLR
jgi:RNA polymerase sigma-70 factor, ECF subfamily